MSDPRQNRRHDEPCDEVTQNHYVPSKTLASIRKRLEILRAENSKLNFSPEADLDATTAAYLATLRDTLRKRRTENTRLAMLGLLKALENELVQRGLDPEVEIEWLLQQLADESIRLLSPSR